MTYHKQDLRVPVHNRLKRLVGDMTEGMACTFDPLRNLLCVNSQVYLMLDKRRQERVWRSERDMTTKEALS